MPTLTPTPTIQLPPAPGKTMAQPPRLGRTNGAIEQDSTSFGSALSSAGDSIANKSNQNPTEPSDDAVEPGDADIADKTETPEKPETDGADPDSGDKQAPDEPTAPAGDDTTDPDAAADPAADAEVATGEDQTFIALAASVPENPTRAPSIAPETPTPEPEAPRRQPAAINAPVQNLADGEPVAPQGDAEESAPVKDASALPILSALAPAPVNKPNADSTSAPVEGPADGQTPALGAAINAETPSGDPQQQQQPDQQQQLGAPAKLPESDPASAQPLRQAGVEPAPGVIKPASVDSLAPLQAPTIQSAQPAATPPPAPAPSLGSVETETAFAGSVQRGLAAAVRQQGGTLTIKLDPPTLGKLTIRMTIDRGAVRATFDAQTAQARDLLIEHASTLRTQLRDRGLTVERLEIVGASSAGAGRAGQSTSNTGEQSGARGEQDDPQHDAAGGQSRGRSETGEDEPSTGDGATGDSARSAGEPMTSPFEARLRYSVSAVA